MAMTKNKMKNAGIMNLLDFSKVFADPRQFIRVSIITAKWNGHTEKSLFDKSSYQIETSLVIRVPVAESNNALSI